MTPVEQAPRRWGGHRSRPLSWKADAVGLTSAIRLGGVLIALSLAVVCSNTAPPYALTRQDCDDIVSFVDAGRERLVAYDLASGREIWSTDGGFGSIPPATRAGIVYMVRTAPAADRTELLAFDAATGAQRWSSTLDGSARGPFFVSYGKDSVAVATTTYNGPFAVLRPEGRGPDQPWTLVTGTEVALGKDGNRRGRLFVSRNEISLVDPDEGTEVWRSAIPALAGPGTDINIDMLAVDDVIIVPTRGLPTGVSGVDAATGHVLWTSQSPPSGVELLGAHASPQLVVVRADGRDGVVLDAKTGQRVVAPKNEDSLEVKPRRYSDSVRSGWTPPPAPGRVVGAATDNKGRGFVLRGPEQSATYAAKALYSRCLQTQPPGTGAPR